MEKDKKIIGYNNNVREFELLKRYVKSSGSTANFYTI